ncbi:chemotaxis protein methyltransferase CheR [Sphingomonas gellani]|uniref:Chemotaxis protein methyltransferase CheR n=1 Tax=Sphingomonas gellani TaxID=1166340 RepID=A0A1H7YFE7_9SPHN|nr:protein-glutamate O-methyltransferase CheR [Sphingomonas gellani]SEM44058.1 chemotaxis protein methyltransferase CheR [Sphingomonas gellani]
MTAMTATAAATSSVSPKNMAVLTQLLEARTGQQIASYRSWRIDTALKPLMRDRGLATLDQLVSRLLGGHDLPLADQIVDALVNGETSFFREATVFDSILAAVTEVEAQGCRARIWSAGCSTGQEPLSLAMLFAERREETGAPIPEIVATDVSETALSRARAGRFSQFEVQRGLPIRRAMRWFEPEPQGDWIASSDLVRQVVFRPLNLVSPHWPPGRFDVILCRNVLLYLSAEGKAGVFSRLAAALKPDGLLVLGAGETVIGQTSAFEPSRRLRGFYELAVPVPGAK